MSPAPSLPARRRRALLSALVLTLGLGVATLPAQAAGSGLVAEAQRLLDAEQPEEALKLLAKVSGKKAEDGEALLLRSTARLLLGDNAEGRRDLELALQLDPRLRQGWLNRAALDVADRRYTAALEALQQAEELAPTAPDNDLNIGAVELLAGHAAPAASRFARYLAGPGNSPQGHYLVAANYAGAGQAPAAVEHLRQAIAGDERLRVRARADANFLTIEGDPGLRALMRADPAPPASDAYQTQQGFAVAYDGAGGKLLAAVLSALQLGNEPFDPEVEVTERWALISGELRVVVRNGANGEGLVEVSAPASAMAANEFNERSEALLRRLQLRLAAGKG